MKRVLCLITAVVMLLGMTACKKKTSDSSKVRTVSKDSVWWNDQIINITEDDINQAIGDKKTTMVQRIAATDEDSFVLCFQIYCEKKDYTTLLMHYSYSGELLGKVCFADCGLSEAGCDAVYKADGKYYCFANSFDSEADEYRFGGYEIDFEQGTLKNPFEINRKSKSGKDGEIYDVIGVGDRQVYLLCSDNGNDDTYEIRVDKDGTSNFFVPSFGSGKELLYINDLVPDGERVAFFASVEENGAERVIYCTLNPDTLEMQTVNVSIDSTELSLLNGGAYHFKPGENISGIDFSTGNETELLKLSDTYLAGLGMFDDVDIVNADDHSAVLYISGESPIIIRLTKAESNPNAGRKILRVAYFDNISDSEVTAVNEFNRGSEMYFLEMDSKYYDKQTAVNSTLSLDDDLSQRNVFDADAVTMLMSDIRDGSGPDLVFYTNAMAQLNSPEYMIDLTSMIESEKSLNDGSYMDFIHQPNGRDGKHYRLDYCFYINGLLIRNDFVQDGAHGLTFEEYDNIIEEKNAGRTDLAATKFDLMNILMENSDCFSYAGEDKIDLRSGDFIKAAEYASSLDKKKLYVFSGEWHLERIQTVFNYDFSSYVHMCGPYYESFSIIGLPSADGHAEAIQGSGIGITKCCELQDGAWEFVKKMMSSEIQKTFWAVNPVLKSVQKDILTEVLARENQFNFYGEKTPEGIIDRYIDQISDAVLFPDIDSSVIVIVNEEIPAFFEGQKSMDDVITVIENRLNLMLKERKAPA